ncbi:MAG: flagellar hook-associated protein 2 [Eubacteriaceae bacterium]|nr:flagellar hook-associated protein 2 [Eubacteriaceae bacterium]
MSSSVSSTTSSSLTNLSAKTGISGLVSGLDTEEIVNSMTLATQQKITKQEQKLQLLEWKQTAYQSVATALKEFQTKYLDVLSSTNFTSSTMFSTIAASSSSSAVSVEATSSAAAGSITINSITQTATNAKYVGATGVTDDLGGTVTDYSNLSDKSFLLTRDGVTKTITLGTVTDASSLKTSLESAVSSAFSDGRVTVNMSGDSFSFTCDGSIMSVSALAGDTTTLKSLGMTSGLSNRLSTSKTLADLPFATDLTGDPVEFSINGVDFSFDQTTTLASIISQVNSSDAGVTMAYSSLTDGFTLTADDSGEGNEISIADTSGNLMAAMGLTSGTSTDGQNAILTVNNVAIVRSSNEFTIDGVKITLEEDVDAADPITDPITIKLSSDTTELKDKIKSFVEDYNTMIDLINGLTKEDKNSDYAPLTDDQKEEMSDSEIEKWEAKAKSGILRGDSLLRGIASNMQSLMYSSAVSGGLSLYNLGIQSAGYAENGKLEIDEEKLDQVLASDIQGVKELFTTETTGIANALDSIIDSAAKTSGARGSRGSLIEKAGYESTTSSTQNSIYDSMQDVNEYIAKLKDQLEDEESRYWSKFTALETALQQLNVQGSMISGFGTSS